MDELRRPRGLSNREAEWPTRSRRLLPALAVSLAVTRRPARRRGRSACGSRRGDRRARARGAARDGDEVIDAAGMALVPGLVNGHTHAAMTLFRGHGDDRPLMEWLEQVIWPVEERIDDEDVYWGTRLACVEMIRTGTVRFWDMYWRAGATARAVEDAGLRATIGGAADRRRRRRRPSGPAATRSAAWSEIGEPRRPGRARRFAPHAIYTVSERSLRWIAEAAAERGLPVQIHLSETEDEVARCVDEHGVRPAEYLDRSGCSGPRTVLAHGCLARRRRARADRLARRDRRHQPGRQPEARGGTGVPLPATRGAAGSRSGWAPTAPGSNNSLDLLSDVKAFALLQKHEAGDPAALTAAEAWELATGRRSPAARGRGRSRRASRPTSCSLRAGRARARASATSTPASSTRRPERSSTPPWSAGGC